MNEYEDGLVEVCGGCWEPVGECTCTAVTLAALAAEQFGEDELERFAAAYVLAYGERPVVRA